MDDPATYLIYAVADRLGMDPEDVWNMPAAKFDAWVNFYSKANSDERR